MTREAFKHVWHDFRLLRLYCGGNVRKAIEWLALSNPTAGLILLRLFAAEIPERLARTDEPENSGDQKAGWPDYCRWCGGPCEFFAA